LKTQILEKTEAKMKVEITDLKEQIKEMEQKYKEVLEQKTKQDIEIKSKD